jgi:uncharacterized UBP type Zn finger protein
VVRRERRRSAAPDATVACAHLAAAGAADEPDPQTPGNCQECDAMGEHNWAHLRMCLTCGHVGCCDSSPRQHATKHFQQAGHPVMRSLEPGESWRWCYVDVALG